MIKEDYKTDSLYNTYLYKGKPPAPICNPGLKAMAAVVYPEESDYLYYLHDKEGQIHPAKTYEEHLENVGGVAEKLRIYRNELSSNAQFLCC